MKLLCVSNLLLNFSFVSWFSFLISCVCRFLTLGSIGWVQIKQRCVKIVHRVYVSMINLHKKEKKERERKGEWEKGETTLILDFGFSIHHLFPLVLPSHIKVFFHTVTIVSILSDIYVIHCNFLWLSSYLVWTRRLRAYCWSLGCSSCLELSDVSFDGFKHLKIVSQNWCYVSSH